MMSYFAIASIGKSDGMSSQRISFCRGMCINPLRARRNLYMSSERKSPLSSLYTSSISAGVARFVVSRLLRWFERSIPGMLPYLFWYACSAHQPNRGQFGWR